MAALWGVGGGSDAPGPADAVLLGVLTAVESGGDDAELDGEAGSDRSGVAEVVGAELPQPVSSATTANIAVIGPVAFFMVSPCGLAPP